MNVNNNQYTGFMMIKPDFCKYIYMAIIEDRVSVKEKMNKIIIIYFSKIGNNWQMKFQICSRKRCPLPGY